MKGIAKRDYSEISEAITINACQIWRWSTKCSLITTQTEESQRSDPSEVMRQAASSQATRKQTIGKQAVWQGASKQGSMQTSIQASTLQTSKEALKQIDKETASRQAGLLPI